MFGWCLQFKQSCPWATLSYFCLQNQSREINAMRRVVSENVSKRAQRYQFAWNAKKSRWKLNLLHCRQKKNHNLYVKNWNKKGIGEKGIAATG
jgi:hypothetical protein